MSLMQHHLVVARKNLGKGRYYRHVILSDCKELFEVGTIFN